MLRRLAIVWDALRSNLWFLPTLIVTLLVALAAILIEIDGAVDVRTLVRFPRLFGAGAEGTRGMLEAIAGAMITVAGVTFSITIVALSLTSSQYSSRVLRNFVRDRSNQTVLGVFVGIYAYCLVVLRTIRGGPDAFVPSIATLGGIILAFVGIALLIHFIHHISRAIQAVHILASIYEETTQAIKRLYPEPIGKEAEAPEENLHDELDQAGWRTVEAQQTGYVQSVDVDALMAVACEHDAIVRLEWKVGDFVAAGQALARISASNPGPVEHALRKAIVQGDQRTLNQDAAFGIRQIVDIAQKALSPGINDPTTAVMCVDRLMALMMQLASRRIPSPYRRTGKELRVIAPAHDFASFLALAMDEIRCQSRSQPPVLMRLAEMLGAIRRVVAGDAREKAVTAELEAIEGAAVAIADSSARAQVQRAIACAR